MQTKKNLNLMQSLDALLDTANVSQAAKRMHISQSAMSNVLTQLRQQFDDPLLVRDKRKMILTPKAQELRPQLHRIISKLVALVEKTEIFDAKTSRRIFKIAMTDIIEYLLLPYVAKQLQLIAPHVELHVQNINYVESLDPFYNNDIEIIFGSVADESVPLCIEPCLSFKEIIFARKDHPFFQEDITLEKFLAAKQIRFEYHTEYERNNIDSTLKAMGLKRNVAMSISHILPLVVVLQYSDYIGTAPLLDTPEAVDEFSLAFQPLPVDVPWTQLHTLYLKQLSNDPGLIWLRGLFKEAAEKLSKKFADYIAITPPK